MPDERSLDEKLTDARTALATLETEKAKRDALPEQVKRASDDELLELFGDALVGHLGSHPRLETIWNEIKARRKPKPAEAAVEEPKAA
jgi:hypothetical protein